MFSFKYLINLILDGLYLYPACFSKIVFRNNLKNSIVLKAGIVVNFCVRSLEPWID